jgi:hypothetical protein
MKTIGEVREASDEVLLILPDFGKSSVAHLRLDRWGPTREQKADLICNDLPNPNRRLSRA